MNIQTAIKYVREAMDALRMAHHALEVLYPALKTLVDKQEKHQLSPLDWAAARRALAEIDKIEKDLGEEDYGQKS